MGDDNVSGMINVARILTRTVEDVSDKVDKLTGNVNEIKVDVAVLKERSENMPERPCDELVNLKSVVCSHVDEHKETKKAIFGGTMHILLEVCIGLILAYLLIKFGFK